MLSIEILVFPMWCYAQWTVNCFLNREWMWNVTNHIYIYSRYIHFILKASWKSRQNSQIFFFFGGKKGFTFHVNHLLICYCSVKIGLTFHINCLPSRQFTWNDKPYFFLRNNNEKNKTKNKTTTDCHLLWLASIIRQWFPSYIPSLKILALVGTE